MSTVSHGTIQNVVERVVNRQSDGKQFIFHDVIDNNGDKWQAKQDVANIARQLVGQPVVMVTRIEQNGTFTNRFIDSVELSQGQGYDPTPVQAPPYAQAAQQAQAQAHVGSAQTTVQLPTSGITFKDEMIFRQTATKVAAHTTTNRADFWPNVLDLIAFYRDGSIPADSDVPF